MSTTPRAQRKGGEEKPEELPETRAVHGRTSESEVTACGACIPTRASNSTNTVIMITTASYGMDKSWIKSFFDLSTEGDSWPYITSGFRLISAISVIRPCHRNLSRGGQTLTAIVLRGPKINYSMSRPSSCRVSRPRHDATLFAKFQKGGKTIDECECPAS